MGFCNVYFIALPISVFLHFLLVSLSLTLSYCPSLPFSLYITFFNHVNLIRSLFLTVKPAQPSLTASNAQTVELTGLNKQIQCLSSSNAGGDLTYTLKYEGVDIEANDLDGFFTISNPTIEDTGGYTCIAVGSNSGATSSPSAPLTLTFIGES